MSERATVTPASARSAPERSEPSRGHPRGPSILSAIGNRGLQRALSGAASGSSSQPQQTPQRSLAVNAPGDRFEIEADRVAQHVMRMPAPALQRTCACGGGCPTCSDHQDDEVQRQTTTGSASMTAPPIVHAVVESQGAALDATTRDFFETRFGRDFSAVRVHADGQAAASAGAVGAAAYTVGSHIAFGSGRYAPQTDAGRRLL